MARQTEAKETEAKEDGPLDLTRIVAEVEALWSEWRAWLHRETGEVYILMGSGEDEAEFAAEIEALIEAGKLVPLEREPWDDHRRVERFIARLGDGEAARRVADAWNRRGRGRWARFKGALDAAGRLEEWYDYRFECVRADVVRLLEMEGIPFREDAGPRARAPGSRRP